MDSFAAFSYASILAPFCKVSAMSSRPLSRQCLRKASISKTMGAPPGRVMVCEGRSTLSAEPGDLVAVASSSSTVAAGRTIGRMPFLKQLLKKMSAKLGAITQRIPKSSRAQGACSRLEPQPKLSRATRMEAERKAGWLRTKEGISAPSEVKRISSKRFLPRPVRLIVLRNCLGMSMSVSTFAMGSGATTPSTQVKGIMPPAACVLSSRLPPVPDAREYMPRAWAPNVRMSVRRPVIAAAAAIAGETRCVRPPRPCRPSKLRFEVEAHRSPATSLSSFMAKHMEQPGSRHSKPAALKMTSRPSSSAIFFTIPEPGTISAAAMEAATFCPFTIAATARKSSIRPLVHEPMKILSSMTVSSFWPGARPMYSSARTIAVLLLRSVTAAGSGTLPVMGRTSSGEVPHVTCGTMSAALTTTSVSYFALESEGRVRQ
mmetsp:Transcript_1696/g.4479  ORF Transcript_1696/g.4479 Transcript_1696/m.4479 type:complete len:431 (+) Transcript_1696:272-1564(+)